MLRLWVSRPNRALPKPTSHEAGRLKAPPSSVLLEHVARIHLSPKRDVPVGCGQSGKGFGDFLGRAIVSHPVFAVALEADQGLADRHGGLEPGPPDGAAADGDVAVDALPELLRECPQRGQDAVEDVGVGVDVKPEAALLTV